MTYNPARRLFLGGSLAATAAGATGIITPAALAAGSSVAAPHVMYGPQAGIAKLNANENPYGPSPAALKAIAEASSTGGAYYAYQAGMYLTDMIAEEYGLRVDKNGFNDHMNKQKENLKIIKRNRALLVEKSNYKKQLSAHRKYLLQAGYNINNERSSVFNILSS